VKLNLGSYLYPLKGYHNVDIEKWDGVDEVVNLESLPWPWTDRTFEHVRAIDILEHLGGITKRKAVEELARVLIVYGTAEVRVPCMSHRIALASLQHAHSFYFNSFERSYAQPWFEVRKIYAGISDRQIQIPYVPGTRFILRFLSALGLVQTITFHLIKVSQ